MRWILAVLAVCGVITSALALREHYRTDTSPCSINERWDCGIVNHSPYAVIGGVVASIYSDPTYHPSLIGSVPVAVIGMVGYLLIGVLAFRRAYRLILLGALGGLAFSLYLSRIEAKVLGVWCIYCVISLGIISLITLVDLVGVLIHSRKHSTSSA
jgi:vitamin-K-epoxide reductase (warfarin-sensitive)